VSENAHVQRNGVDEFERRFIVAHAHTGVTIPITLPEDVKIAILKLSALNPIPNTHFFGRGLCSISIDMFTNDIRVALHTYGKLPFKDINRDLKKVLTVAKVVFDELLKCFDTYIEVLKNLMNPEALEKVIKQFVEEGRKFIEEGKEASP